MVSDKNKLQSDVYSAMPFLKEKMVLYFWQYPIFSGILCSYKTGLNGVHQTHRGAV